MEVKPLPPPPANEIPALTIDAIAHLSDIIRYSVKARSLSPVWEAPLESATKQLSQWLSTQAEFLCDTRSSRQNNLLKAALDAPSVPDVPNEPSTINDASLAASATQNKDNSKPEPVQRLYMALQNQNKGTDRLLVTVAAPPAAVTAEDLSFHIVPASSGCIFEASSFHLPFFEHSDGTTRGEGGSIVCGLDVRSSDALHIIGGSFRFQGLTSVREYRALVEVLSIAVYCVTSLILELNLFQDSGVELQLPSEPVSDAPAAPSPTSSMHQAGHRERAKSKAAKAKEGLWSYLTKQSETILGRVRTISMDSSSQRPVVPPATAADVEASKPPPLPPFSAEVRDVNEAAGVLSTTPGLYFPPPILLAEIADKEAKTGQSDVTASQNAGLRSILGWSVDHHLAGPNAFLRHQCITTLYSEYVPVETPQPDEENDGGQSTVSWTPCVPRKWRTYPYYSRTYEEDGSLGELIMNKCTEASKSCSAPQCKFKGNSHQIRWVTGRTRIMAKFHVNPARLGGITMWLSCHECAISSKPAPMNNGTWLLSFGKYLELLAYSDTFATLSTPLCEHTKAASKETKDLTRLRSNIIRHYAYKSYIMSFSTSPVQDVYDVRIPRVQITRIRAMTSEQEGATIRNTWQGEERAELRLQITAWWQGIKGRLTQLEELLSDGESTDPRKKPLPLSPPLSRNPTNEDITPKAPFKALPPIDVPKDLQPGHKSAAPSISSMKTNSTSTSSTLSLLSNLRQTFAATEQSLYANLSKTAPTSLNDARRQFYSTSKAASNRLEAWEKKHTPKASEYCPHTPYPEPHWWSRGFHALPGGSVIVREGEWASMIAFTLSSSDYAAELLDMSKPRAASSVGAEAGSTAPTNSVISSKSDATAETAVSQAVAVEVNPAAALTAFVASVQALASSKSVTSTLDPDDESTASGWHLPESLSSQTSRRDHPKDGSNIMSLRDVLRNKVSADGTSLASRFSNMTSSNASNGSKITTKAPPSAFGSASLELATQNAQGSVAPPTPEAVDVFEQILRNADADDYTFVDSLNISSAASTVKGSARSGTAPSVNSDTYQSDTPRQSAFLNPPAVPPKDFPTLSTSVATTPATEKTESQMISDMSSNTSHTTESNLAAASAMGSLTSTIANAMRFVLNVGQQETEGQPTPAIPHHGLLAMESPDIDSRPHIRYDCVVGKRLKFSCTVYYAKQFDSLRRRCGVGEILIQSLKKTENWSAEGGKSKSNFWKTTDDRFIIKTLVDAWNVADLQVLIELGPSYFRYMDKTTKKPSVMAKLLGFFTVELKNLETGAIQSKADLLIMENLFYERKISQTFDLKGIEGRKVKPSGKGPQSRTLFDGEWLEGQKRALILLHPHSKTILEEGISGDADFLAKSNIMDYSLLLGVDSEQKHLACGLVDTIGSYTFAKTLEYKAKQNIRKEVTVVPPTEYRDRFVKAINSYFVACPDKWSHPGPDFAFPSRLPSVL